MQATCALLLVAIVMSPDVGDVSPSTRLNETIEQAEAGSDSISLVWCLRLVVAAFVGSALHYSMPSWASRCWRLMETPEEAAGRLPADSLWVSRDGRTILRVKTPSVSGKLTHQRPGTSGREDRERWELRNMQLVSSERTNVLRAELRCPDHGGVIGKARIERGGRNELKLTIQLADHSLPTLNLELWREWNA